MKLLVLKKTILVIGVLFLARFTAIGQSPLDTLSYLRQNPNVYAILIEKNDSIIYRKFFNHHTESDRFNDQSLTKSIISLLVGIAIEAQFIKSADEKIVDFFPELKQDSAGIMRTFGEQRLFMDWAGADSSLSQSHC